ncbi:indolepyruvate ferredoxin oxidoreductase alpha subunit [Salinimicrobium catena]|uniref:Indolepyruvate oxidoreductase subunit IorA n=1 Tax=Salinimicrobium catena TaxID=390640 RepID=A0A1H5NW23_9FLAO|nr:thiamine pyrophosphate-dependent enzyme [Salinimicrobium catena]SDL59905.1 indolepyruvate ferredoxin oxidoreductase alpha subunit [Salinimicrobium catena]SEF05650.1 indolepyruvate ferredoxin oxidoreductase alpha subunit [Salinimicrobium catena]
MKSLLLGNEALAQGSIDAGLSGVYAYPGTPSTEITEYIQKSKLAQELKIHTTWSVNEKTAMEAALGMSYVGKRSMVVMKHVGLNVASDVFMNMAVSGINGGLVVVVADDPSMHSSQNEQDSRFYGKFAMIPILEPSSQQEAYDVMSYAFDLSEDVKLPVLLRMVTRLSHSRAGIKVKQRRDQNEIDLPRDTSRFALLPSNARKQFDLLVSKKDTLVHCSETSNLNSLRLSENRNTGIIACGLAYNYLMENIGEDLSFYSILKISQYPLPKEKIQALYRHCDKIIVMEEGYPIVEELLHNYFDENDKIKGRLSGDLPRTGELNPNIVGRALGLFQNSTEPVPSVVTPRPPQLCDGCGHTDLFNTINEVIREIGDKNVFGDIGCYALGALPPMNTVNTLIDMGASITMAKGAADAGMDNAIAVIGDSTFTHSGMTGLLDAVYENSPITVIISDNSAVAMTGAQESTAVGRLHKICLGLGVHPDHLKTIVPLKKNHDENVEVLRNELKYKGVSVIISERPCVRLSRDQKEVIKAKIAALN